MPSPHQITARRRNSLKSTGPRPPHGKSASSRNALKTGIGSNAPDCGYCSQAPAGFLKGRRVRRPLQ